MMKMQSEFFSRTILHAVSKKPHFTVKETFSFLFQSRAARTGYEQHSKEGTQLWRGEQQAGQMWEQDRTRNSSPAGRWDGGEEEMVAVILGTLWEGRASLEKGHLAPEEELRTQIPW